MFGLAPDDAPEEQKWGVVGRGAARKPAAVLPLSASAPEETKL